VSILINVKLSAQDKRIDRIGLQYQFTQCFDSAMKNSLIIKITDAYFQDSMYQEANNWLERINTDSKIQNIYYLSLAKTQFMLDENERSLRSLSIIDSEFLGIVHQKDYQLLTILNYNHLLKYDLAANYLSEVLLKKEKDTSGISTFYRINTRAEIYDIEKVRKKSKILPFLGLIYVDEPKKAVINAFLNLTFLGYGIYSYYNQYYVTGTLTGASQFMRFYSGGKRASIKIAERKNNIQNLEIITKLDDFCYNKLYYMN
jgi:hypothetical protein